MCVCVCVCVCLCVCVSLLDTSLYSISELCTTPGLGYVVYCYVAHYLSYPSPSFLNAAQFPSEGAYNSCSLYPLIVACRSSAQYHMTAWVSPVYIPAYPNLCHYTWSYYHLSVASIQHLPPLPVLPVAPCVLQILALATPP